MEEPVLACPLRSWFLGCILFAIATPALADSPAPPAFTEIGHDYPGFDLPDAARIAVGDFDSDGKQDFAFVGSTGLNSVKDLSVVGLKPDATIGFKQQSILPDPQVVRVLTLPQASGSPHLLTIGPDGQVREFAGWPLAESFAFTTLPSVVGATVGDLFGDGVQRLALCTGTKIAVYDPSSGSANWSIPFQGCSDIFAYQLDASGPMELIIAGVKPGVVLDASNGSTEWSYPDSFGTSIAAGRLGANGEIEFVTGGQQITVFSANPYSPLWDYSDGYYFSTNGLFVTDIDADGRDDIIFQEANGPLQALDSITQTARPFSSANSIASHTLAVADINGSGMQRLIGADDNGVFVADETTGDVIWKATSSTLEFNVMALGDVDSDGRNELLSAIGVQAWNANSGLQIRDFSSGRIEWTSSESGNANDAFETAPYRFLLDTQLGVDDPKIIVAGSAVYDGRILVVDGKTRIVDAQIGYYSDNGPLASRVAYDAILADVDGDGINDIVAATAPDMSWVYGAKLQAFSLLGTPLWESVGMGDYRINGVFAMPANLGIGDELVAVLPDGLRAYGRLGHLLDWTLPVTNDGAFLVTHGASGPEIAIENDNVISFYDAASKSYLRQTALIDQVDAAIALDGNARQLLVSSGGHLRVIDGVSGTELASTPYLGDDLASPNQLGVASLGPNRWQIAAGNRLGIFRYMLSLSDRIFANGFE